ncbi:MAG TPA: anthranilate phosphoribosyltransferase [Methylophaga aminisulfidivorans]|uniref:Anthranilate phosphoribosyltransferase n=2 Tax=root TaxID=1 RepID=A0A7C1W662_9GAMM|nr:anthranilate phosphoribosyltransferase [Methylophaga aminisulfidivorans]
MDIQSALKAIVQKQDLTDEQMQSVMNQIMTGNATSAQIGGFLIGLQMKGETVTEIAAAATVMRSLATPVSIEGDHVVDTCGTGGDGASTFNVSTASAFVAAAAGCQVAKHGNRSISSSSGSADVLEAAGVNLELTAEQVKNCIEKIGVGFMFAQKHHGAMKHAIGPRREMGVRTIFNLLGPLTNPARARRQVMGVFDKKWVYPMAEVLQKLGSEHVLVVHAEDGLDEISIGSKTHVAELKNNHITSYTIEPEQFGLNKHDITALSVTNAHDSLTLIKAIFDGEKGPARDIVILNAGAAIYAADITQTLAEGISLAAKVIDSGAATQKLNALIVTSRS